jgi:CheY-like chemotaxis protein
VKEHRRKIVEALGRQLDPAAFEACVVALLRDDGLQVVPIKGGSDAGMDGAIADDRGEPFPLVTTTAENVIGNLTRNLDAYVAKRGTRRKVVVATSTALTPQRYQNLLARARERGFVLVRVYEREAIADLLYRNSAWTKDLLEISGRPSALSALPRTRRPLLELPLVGRSADLGWLMSAEGDCLIAGQPGSGKTHLLRQLVKLNRALFLVSDDALAVANAYRDLRPELVLVDDAHADIQVLDRLRQLRQEIDGDFKIIASTWPGSKDDVAAALAISGSQVRSLELMTRSEIVEVLHAMGIAEEMDDPLLRFLVDESSNKPGLAVVLGSLLLRGELEDLFSGQALKRSLIPSLKQVLGADPTRLLACYALGGSVGFPIRSVGDYLELSLDEVSRRTIEAGHGGIASEQNDRIALPSELLRSALIGEAFFPPEGPRLDPVPLLETAPSPGTSVDAIVRAYRRGAHVTSDVLHRFLRESGKPETWALYAEHSEAAARWVVQNYPRQLAEIGSSVLAAAPQAALPELLRSAAGAAEPLHAQQGGPLHAIREWLQEIPSLRRHSDPVEECLRRRELLVEVAVQSKAAGIASERPVEAACLLSLSPNLEGTRSTVTGDRFIIRRGILPPTAVPRILVLWRRIRSELRPSTRESWQLLDDLLQRWVYPESFGKEPPEADAERYRDVARAILSDLATRAQDRPGFARALEQWALKVDLDLDLVVEPEFRILFPTDLDADDGEWHEREARQKSSAVELAHCWAAGPAREIAERLVVFEESATAFIERLGWHTRLAFYDALAAAVGDVVSWSLILLEEGLDARWLVPFVRRIIDEGQRHDEVVARFLEDERYAWLGAYAALLSSQLTDATIRSAMEFVPEHVVSTATAGGEVPERTSSLLLQYSDEAIRISALVGEWLADPRGSIRGSIELEWRTALLMVGDETAADDLRRQTWRYWLKAILSSDRELASEWLFHRISKSRSYEPVSKDGLFAAAVQSLGANERLETLSALPSSDLADKLVVLIVGDSGEIYRHLLARGDLREHHLRPLGGRIPDDVYAGFAALALEAGHDPAEIAAEAFLSVFGGGYSGSGVEHWSKWLRGFERMRETTSGRLREVAEQGLRQAEGWLEPARREERRRELAGF